MSTITIPDWIACRTYFPETEKSKTIISSQKTHQTVLLDGLASDCAACSDWKAWSALRD